MGRQKISAFIVCCNEEHQIRRALESVSWCDQIVLLDSGSTDATLTIAREFTNDIFVEPWRGFVGQKRRGLDLCLHPWVVNIDADEVVTSELRAEIEQFLSSSDAAEGSSTNGAEILRVVFHLGRWWRKGGWHPEYRLRLLRRSVALWGGNDPHEHAIVPGKIRRFKGELLHYSFDDLADHVRSTNAHSSAAAATLVSKGVTVPWLNLITRPCGRFIKFFFVRRGYREGLPGLIAAVVEAFYAFLKYAKVIEARRLISRCPQRSP